MPAALSTLASPALGVRRFFWQGWNARYGKRMNRRAFTLGAVAALGVALVTSGCAPQQAYDPNGRCLGWQLAVAATVHPSSTTAKPSWDLTFKNTSGAACVFGGVPGVRFDGKTPATPAGDVEGAVSQEWAVQLSPGDVAYANVLLDPAASAACTATPVRTLHVVAPHVAGGKYTVKAPAAFTGCAGTAVVAHVGQVTAKRAK
jgi:Protein of unknown function (DUF4232)